MRKCFVIQVFDGNKFDKRFADVFKPAIEAAELEAYRIDQDSSVKILTDGIEKNIKESKICFADITLDNPNVWYELGFAFASGKDVVMVCSEDRKNGFPFDIQHRKIITYETGSSSDFKTLEKNITAQLKAYKKTSKTVEKPSTSPVLGAKVLKSHEIAILILITENQYTDNDFIAIHKLRDEMEKAGYTNIETSVGIKALKNDNLIKISTEVDGWHDNAEFEVCKLTKNGEDWVICNQNKPTFKMKDSNNSADEFDDDLPF